MAVRRLTKLAEIAPIEATFSVLQRETYGHLWSIMCASCRTARYIVLPGGPACELLW